MPSLPTGTVSLLFTDIEGSTRLQQRVGDGYANIISDHHRLLRQAFEANGGRIVDSQADSFFCAFQRVRHAVSAAAAAQHALAEHPWPDGVEVRVRMGIHAGEPEVAGDRYLGLPVVRAARICDTGHGGQVLLSSSARGLLADQEPDGVRIRDLGTYNLKDFDRPERIAQLVVDGLPSDFPPLRTGVERRRRRPLILASSIVAGLIAVVLAVVLVTGGSGDRTMGETSVGVIDPATSELVDDIPVGFRSSLIAAGEGFVWAADPNGSTLVKIDPETREVAARFGVETGATPFGLAAGLGAVWLAVQRGEAYEVLELGPEFGELRNRIPFGERAAPVLPGLNLLALGEGEVWVVDPSVGGLWRIEPKAGKATKLTDGLNVSSLAIDAGAVWAGSSLGVTRIDTATGETIAQAQLVVSVAGETTALALGDDALSFVTSSEDSLFRLHPETGNVLSTVAVGPGPTGVAISGADVWVVSSRAGTAAKVEPDELVTVVDLGTAPGGVTAGFDRVWVSAGEPRR